MANGGSELRQDLRNGAVGAALGALIGIVSLLFNLGEFSWALGLAFVGGAAIVCFVLAFLAGEIVLEYLKHWF